MRAIVIAVFALLASAPASLQAQGLVTEVRAAIARQDFAQGERLIAAHRAAEGVTPLALEALSWMGRGALAAGQLEPAESYARQTYDLTLDVLKRRRVDDDPRLATALGASIEVLAQAGAKRGARSEAVAFLRQELEQWGGTSLRKRIQKNINLLSLEGLAAPALDLADYVGPAPPVPDALKGKVVLLFFWAHWCGDCKAQVPILTRLIDRYGQSGLTVIGPTQRYGYVAGGKAASAEEEAQYIDRMRLGVYGPLRGMPVPIATSNLERYGVSTTPTLVLIDRRGVVRLYRPGRIAEDELDSIVRAVMDSRRP